jgi:hypothetical protein
MNLIAAVNCSFVGPIYFVEKRRKSRGRALEETGPFAQFHASQV